MDGAELFLTNPVMPLSPLEGTAGSGFIKAANRIQRSGTEPAGTEKTEQLAKEFETVLLTKLVDAMKETVGNWGLEKEDAAAGQMQGLFWMYLAQDIGDKGGLGLWKDLHRFFCDMQNPAEPPTSVDESL